MLAKTLMSFGMKTLVRSKSQVTFVESPPGSSVKTLILRVSNGFTKSTVTETLRFGTDRVISVRPRPVLPLPCHSDAAPTPAAASFEYIDRTEYACPPILKVGESKGSRRRSREALAPSKCHFESAQESWTI